MNVAHRITRYKAIEAARNRPLIVYATTTRPGVNSMLAGDAVREFIDQIDAIKDSKAIDVLIHSTGGDALAAWKLMSVLRERFESVGVLVPFMAFSAATIFALGADEIVMHPHASLGPIDPQVTIRLPDGKKRQFSFEDVGAFLRFLSAEIGLTEQAYVSAVVERLFKTVDPVNLGAAKRASELSTDVGERLLQMHMKSSEQRTRARAIAENLNKTFFAHGDAVSRSRARKLELQVAKNNVELERLMWDAYVGIEEYLQVRTPFKPLEHFIANGGAAVLGTTSPLVLPPNTPQNVANQIWTQAAQTAIQAMSAPAVQVQYEVVNALIESPRVASEYRTRGYLTAARIGGGEVQLAVTDTETGWRPVAVPALATDTSTGAPAEAGTEL